MKQILVYGDSLTWGIIPGTRRRLDFDKRWPGVLEGSLAGEGVKARVIENCLNGRRTAWSDPFKPGRDGSGDLAQAVEMNSPLALVILMLGSNDFQCTHDLDAYMSSQGTAKLVNIIRQAPIEPGMPVPPVMIVAPPPIVAPAGVMADKFRGAEKRALGLTEQLARTARELGARFFDSGQVVAASRVDGIHLDEEQHLALGRAMCPEVGRVINS